jgi:short-subunit dehydrogenase
VSAGELRPGGNIVWAASECVLGLEDVCGTFADDHAQSLRVILAAQGVRVHAVLTGPVDTEMTRGLDTPKASPESVAQRIFDGVVNDEDEIFPDALSQSLTKTWRSSAAKVLEEQYAALLAGASAVKS